MLASTNYGTQQATPSSSGCAVCGDKVNGNRYGALACLGCIVFFRRAILKNSQYSCQRDNECAIETISRSSCRSCRLQKCLKMGMNPEKIQRRDMMGPRKKRENDLSPEMDCTIIASSPCDVPFSCTGVQVDPLLRDLSTIQERQHSSARHWFAPGKHEKSHFMNEIINMDIALHRRWGELDSSPSTSSSSCASANSLEDVTNINWGVVRRTEEGLFDYSMDSLRRARKEDINVMFRLGIVDSVEWGSQFTVFTDLQPGHKRALLREYSIGFMLIDQGYNTSKQNNETLWILQHDKVFMCTDYNYMMPEQEKILPTEAKAKLHPDFVLECIKGVGNPMRDLKIELFELMVLKTLLLFECFNFFPFEKRPEIALIRERCLNSLAAYEAAEHPRDGVERIGTILLLIGNIRSCILSTSRQLHVCDVFSLMKFEPLVADILLNKY